MKKILLQILFITISFHLFADTYTITNTFGGDKDKMNGSDFFELRKSKSSNDETIFLNDNPMLISDRFQFDINQEKFEGRIRLDANNLFQILENSENNEDSATEEKSQVILKGFGKLNITPNISIVAGNSFFSKFDIKSAELFACDDVPNYGRIIKNGLAVFGEIPFNKKGSIKLNLGTGFEYDLNVLKSKELKLDIGADYQYKKLFSTGFSARNITAGEFGKYSVFAGGNFKDFKGNLGFIYNNTDEDILLAETKYCVSTSVKYKNDDLKFTAAGDIVSGINSEHLSSSSGKTKKYKNNAIPFMSCLSFDYDLTENLNLNLNLKYSDMLNTFASTNICIYPNCTYKFAKKQEVAAGLRFIFDKKTGTGLTNISIPVSYKVKISK